MIEEGIQEYLDVDRAHLLVVDDLALALHRARLLAVVVKRRSVPHVVD